jgi:hypothetical protein
MKMDAVINQLAHITGKSRKEIIGALRAMSSMPEVQKAIRRKGNDQKARKNTH